MSILRALPLITTVLLFSVIGLLISSLQYDISYFSEYLSALSAISIAAYCLYAVIRDYKIHHVVVGGAFLVASFAYFMPSFNNWSVTILTDFSIILFAATGVIKDGMCRQKETCRTRTRRKEASHNQGSSATTKEAETG